ncbi:ABC transporter permease [Pontibacter locisalis]|uniref:Transport permease protein n=1 Tax=Pontibacter locisalis TaxID=1719035 RepID=A0ABW5INE4_9BACT
MTNKARWEWEINNKTNFWGNGLKELWLYRYLLAGLVRRHFLLNYQQTVLGPFWVLLQPVITLIIYVVVFNKLVGISTETIPPVAFYASGIVLWNFFSESFTGTATTFRDNAQIFSKVYFPRIIMPLSVISTYFMRFSLQLLLFLLILTYYHFFTTFEFRITFWILALPISVLFTGAIGLGMGLFFSVITAKYRDFINMIAVGVRLLMFITPVIYPMIAIPEKARWIIQLNPLTPLFELFRLSLLNQGYVTPLQVAYSVTFSVLILLGSVLLFNKKGDKLIDII